MSNRLRYIADHLDQLEHASTARLAEQVINAGACIAALLTGKPPPLTGRKHLDGALAEQFCGGCPVQRECLELELRWSGPNQVGAFGPLPGRDRRALYPIWRARRTRGGGQR